MCVYSDNLEAMERLLGLMPDGELRIALRNYHYAFDDVHSGHRNGRGCLLCGAETGVLLTEALSETHGVSTNGTAQSLERRS